VTRTRPERVSWPSRVAVSTWTLRRAKERQGRSPEAPVAWSSRRLSYVNRHIEMPTLPPIFDTILGLGATKLLATCPHPFLHLRERSETLAVVVTFSPFLREKLPVMPKWRVLLCTVATTSPRQKKTKTKENTNGRDAKMKNGLETEFQTGGETLGGKRNFRPYGM
jgi:hypothetical protein